MVTIAFSQKIPLAHALQVGMYGRDGTLAKVRQLAHGDFVAATSVISPYSAGVREISRADNGVFFVRAYDQAQNTSASHFVGLKRDNDEAPTLLYLPTPLPQALFSQPLGAARWTFVSPEVISQVHPEDDVLIRLNETTPMPANRVELEVGPTEPIRDTEAVSTLLEGAKLFCWEEKRISPKAQFAARAAFGFALFCLMPIFIPTLIGSIMYQKKKLVRLIQESTTIPGHVRDAVIDDIRAGGLLLSQPGVILLCKLLALRPGWHTTLEMRKMLNEWVPNYDFYGVYGDLALMSMMGLAEHRKMQRFMYQDGEPREFSYCLQYRGSGKIYERRPSLGQLLQSFVQSEAELMPA